MVKREVQRSSRPRGFAKPQRGRPSYTCVVAPQGAKAHAKEYREACVSKDGSA